jgi:hypothetical protein
MQTTKNSQQYRIMGIWFLFLSKIHFTAWSGWNIKQWPVLKYINISAYLWNELPVLYTCSRSPPGSFSPRKTSYRVAFPPRKSHYIHVVDLPHSMTVLSHFWFEFYKTIKESQSGSSSKPTGFHSVQLPFNPWEHIHKVVRTYE